MMKTIRKPCSRVTTAFVVGFTFVTVTITLHGKYAAIQQFSSNVHIQRNPDMNNYKRSSSEFLEKFSTEKSPDRQAEAVTNGKDKVVRAIQTPGADEKCEKRLPQAIIVGIQKSGTSALLKFLSVHPQIAACLSPPETMYFSSHYNKPLDWYRNLMPCSYSNQITMEKSPPYFYRSYCAERIKKMNSNTKIVLIVKDPIVRALSMFAMLKEYEEVGGTTFEDFVTINNRTEVNTRSTCIESSKYEKYMRVWLSNFKMDQIWMVDGHNFELHPDQELNKLENFLQIGTYFTPDKFVFNKAKGKYCLPKETGGTICLSNKKGRSHPSVSQDVQNLLERYFKPLNEKFFNLTQKRFEWGY